MNTRPIHSIHALFFFAILAVPVIASAQNLVSNPGFESGTTGWAARSGGTFAIAGSAHTGANCGRSFNRTATFQGIRQSMLNIMQPGKVYLCEGWVRTNNAATDTLSMSVDLTVDAVQKFPFIASVSVSSAGWSRVKGSFAMEAGSVPTALSIYFAGCAVGTEIFLDDVSVTPVDLAAPENLVSNPGLDIDISDWATHSGATVAFSSPGHTGSGCIVASNRTTGTFQGVEQNMLGKLKPGLTYFVSAWVKTDNAVSDSVKISFQRTDGTNPSTFVNSATGTASNVGWTYITGYYTPTAATNVTFWKLYAEGPAIGTTLYLDDVYVAPVTGLRKASAAYPNVRLGAGGVSSTELQVGAKMTGAWTGNFHLFSPGNSLKVAATEATQNVFTLAQPNASLDFGQAHGGSSRGHCFVWHSGLPTWLSTGASNGTFTATDMRNILWNHIDTVATYYKERLPYWDVVNEAMSDTGGVLRSTLWYDTPGIGYAANGNQYISEAFIRARANDPDVQLIYNDYSIETTNTKSTAVYNMLSALKTGGTPVDGIGFQAHLSGTSFSGSAFRTNLQRFNDLPLNIHITELDDRLPVDSNGFATPADLTAQGQVYFDVFGNALAMSNLKVLQTWGVYDGSSWIPGTFPGFGQGLPFDFNLDRKPAYWGMWNALGGQAEKLTVIATSPTNTNVNDVNLSAGSARRLNSTAIGDFMTLAREVPFKGQWNVKVGVLKANSSGQMQFAIAPPGSSTFTNYGATTDTYAAANAAAEIDFGTVTFANAGDHQFRFTVTGKNASSSNFNLRIDYIRLTPVACDPNFPLPVTDQSIALNTSLSPVLFMAEDDTAIGSLAVAAASSNLTLLPNAGITISGGSPYYTLAATPATDKLGTAIVSVTANDGTTTTTSTFTLTVTGTPLQTWRMQNFGTTADNTTTAFDADPEKDGIANGLEWILGGNPNSSSNANVLPQAATNPSAVTLTFTRSDDSESASTLYAQWGSSLTGWTDVVIGAASSGPDANGVTVTVTENGTAPDSIVVSVPRSNSVQGRLFVRLKATSP